jgi:hypothetical protein
LFSSPSFFTRANDGKVKRIVFERSVVPLMASILMLPVLINVFTRGDKFKRGTLSSVLPLQSNSFSRHFAVK